MPRKGRTSTSDLLKDVVPLPLHIAVLLVVMLLAVVGMCAGIIYLSYFKLPVSSQITPLTPSTGTSQATVHASPTVKSSLTAQPNPYPPHTGSLVLNDPLKDNNKGYSWDTGTFATGSSCTFTGDSYHVAVSMPKPSILPTSPMKYR